MKISSDGEVSTYDIKINNGTTLKIEDSAVEDVDQDGNNNKVVLSITFKKVYLILLSSENQLNSFTMIASFYSIFKRKNSYKSFLLFLFLGCFQLSSIAQVQIGGDIDGEAAGDRSGISVSMPDAYTVAIGAPYNGGNGRNAGHVRVYKLVGSNWVQKGVDIDGEDARDYSGTSITMPDSNTIAIGAIGNKGGPSSYAAGHVRVYTWNGSIWVQKGSDIDGGKLDFSGNAVSMPNKNTIAIGAKLNDGVNGKESGHVRIYIWNGHNWVQKGSDIDGEAAYDRSGFSVSMPDPSTVAIGAPYNDDNGSQAGHTRVYRWGVNSWVQKGKDIDGSILSGYSVSMPDSQTVAIGTSFGNSTSGDVRVFSWNGSAWVKKGNINGAYGDQLGFSVSMVDSNNLVAGAPQDNSNGNSLGYVRFYHWNGNGWIQKGNDIKGEVIGDVSGFYVSGPDQHTVAIGAPFNDGNGLDAGHVRVYTCNSSEILNIITCYSYTSPSGNYTWTTSGKYQDTIQNSVGCDSLITINLTVNDSSFASISPVACESYTSPSGNYTWTKSGTYKDTIPSLAGCDSLITINLTVNRNTLATIAPAVCDSYVSPSSNYTWTTSGTYQDTIANARGCDSLLTINLMVYKSSASSISPNVCSIYTSSSGKFTWTSTGTYFDTIPNSVGCDSIITVNLTIQNTTGSIFPVACESYTSPSKNYIWTRSGKYYDTIPNAVGCDSLISINLTVKRNSLATIAPIVCGNYVSPSGNYTWKVSGMYHDTISNSVGCDSLITINLTVKNKSSAIIAPTVCGNYISPSGNYTWLSSGTYQDTISNAAGCDSLITINLTVNNNTYSSISPSSCESYISPSGKYIWTKAGTYYDTIPNVLGCDSIITIFLNIQNSAANTSITVCEPFLSPSGKYIWNTSGIYQDTIANTANCDSIITIHLTIDPIITTVSVLGDTLIANEINATYQWLNCEDSITTMPFAINRFFVPMENNGSYSVILKKLGCVDTSECVVISSKFEVENIKVFPNPSKGIFTIEYPFDNGSKGYKISDINGKVVHKGLINNQQSKIDLSELSSGIYLLKIGADAVKLVLD